MSQALSRKTRAWPLISRAWLETSLLAAAFAVAVIFNLALRLNPDVAWLYVIAEKCLNGAVLYKDIVAVNAPLASISLMPAVLLRHATSLPIPVVVTLYVSMLGLASILGCARLIDRYDIADPDRVVMKASVFVAIFLLPGIEFGEREHLFCILALPYVFAVPLRVSDRLPGRLAGFAFGFVAGVACNLKPPFAAVILAVELSSLAMLGWRSLFTSAMPGLVVSAVLSVAAYVFVFPLYVTAVLPWMVSLYGAYDDTATTLREALLWGGTAAAMAWVWGGVKGDNARRGFWWVAQEQPTLRPQPMAVVRWVLLAVSAAGILVFLLQDKGWDYQAFVVAFCAVIMTGLAFHASAGRPWARVAVGLVMLVLLTRGVVQFRAPDYVDYHFPDVKRLVTASPGRFLILTTAGTPAGRHIIETGHAWASRYPCLEMLPGIVAAERRGAPSPWEAMFREAVAEDLGHYAPPLIFVQRDDLPGLPPNFDLLGWLMRDPGFAAQWAHYRADGGADGHFAVFRRI